MTDFDRLRAGTLTSEERDAWLARLRPYIDPPGVIARLAVWLARADVAAFAVVVIEEAAPTAAVLGLCALMLAIMAHAFGVL